ncbi:IS66 family insertion sequence element accessory protein TnpA [Ectothiorhodospira sp. 9100]|uniref:IS66 family insertion sequence element accessory protein TnpA n=1 Tax=Ectothiorhodospira sp. 9100 TaxID=2897388 RepID=UPI003FCEAFBF
MSQAIRRTRRSREQWQALVDDFRAGDLSVEAFCRKRRLPEHRFKWWQSRLGGSSAQGRPADNSKGLEGSPWFAELSVNPPMSSAVVPAQTSGWDVELTLGPGMVLRVRRGQSC